MRIAAVSLRKAFTLIELMIVIVIVGVLSTLAVIQLSGPKEEALEKEAKSNLQIIAAAEKMYRLESGGYVDAENVTEINAKLRLMLPANPATMNWQYSVTTSAGFTEFNATATRTGGPKKDTVYSINQTPSE
ncbi:MAG: prepilin-type N-terminal cleavage/methylation domain-containing protein [Candidatus Omnitrophota bacterium]